jgi:hypothetical protein
MTKHRDSVFCSYVDLNYLPRLVALVESIQVHSENEQFYLLCLDPQTYDLVNQMPKHSVQAITVHDIERSFPELQVAKKNRSSIEYVFTLTPYLLRFVADQVAPNVLVNYLDADLFFFGPPERVTKAMQGFDVGIVPHHYPDKLSKSLKKYGQFNVGLVAVRNSDLGRFCLNWWASQCLEWCGDEPLDGKYADQGYLDQFPDRFQGVKVLDNRGFNLAPWNTSGQNILHDPNGHVLLGNQTPLTFFHFHGLKRFGKWMVTSQLNYKSPASEPLIEHVYKPYLRALQRAEAALGKQASGRPIQKLVRGKGLRKWARTLSGKLLMVASVLTGNAVDMSRLK